MYGQNHLAQTGLAAGAMGYAVSGLTLVTLGLMVLAVLALLRRRRHPKP